MPLDPAAKGLLELLDMLEIPALGTLEPAATRQAFEALRDPDAEVEDVSAVQDLDIEGVPCRVYTPEGTGPFAMLVWFHGGGWVIGSMEETDATARVLCNRSGAVVVNVDYRLAPEHPFPAAADDALAVSRWIKDNASSLGGDPARVAVGGDSAGGNLAAVAAQQVPGVYAYQVLIYPVTDATMSHSSYTENADGYLLTKQSMEWFLEHYAADADPTDPKLSPLYASEEVLAAQPPTFLLTAGFDPLRDEGQAYADKLEAAGVAVERVHYPDQIHAFFTMYAAIPAGLDAIAQACAAMKKALG